MKLVDLLFNQKIIIQLIWGEQKIEFYSGVTGREGEVVYVTPYIHNGSELQLNVTEGRHGVVCNVFADNSTTGQRISWRNVELTTVNKNGRTVYCIRTRGFNKFANPDDRRRNERIVVQLEGRVSDPQAAEDTNVTLRDISGVGIAFYAPKSYVPKSQQITVYFTDTIDEKEFAVRVECTVSRINVENDHAIVGCRLIGENRDFQIYRFIKHLREKNGNKNSSSGIENENTDATIEAGKAEEKAEE